MKLVLCKVCQDVVRLLKHKRYCDCGSAGGWYSEDGLYAFYFGFGIPIGFNNFELVMAVRNQPETGMGKDFGAFVIPKQCATFTYLGEDYER